VSLSNFYARRALRLFPALVVAIAVALFIIAIGRSFGLGDATLTGLPFVVFYIGDFARAFGPAKELGLLGTAWSLAIEEQFYLIWPFVFLAVMPRARRKERVAIVLAALSVLDMVYRVVMVRVGEPLARFTFATDTRCDGLLLGCAVAFWLASRNGRPFSAGVGHLLHVATVAGLLLTAVVVIKGSGDIRWTFEIGIPIAVVTTAASVAAIVSRPLRPLSWILGLGPLVWLGRRSYGVYLFHYPIFVAVHANGGSHADELLGVVLSILVAALSYHFFEKPALRLKQRFQKTEALPALPD
jgi:peptidoglycan/LPS O-acetylase OafA/YrhL